MREEHAHSSYLNQRGVGLIIILFAIVILLIVGLITYFLLQKDSPKEAPLEQTETVTEQETISPDQVPFKICETGEGDDCNDTVSDEAVDNLELDDMP